jgi:hypothetical protein
MWYGYAWSVDASKKHPLKFTLRIDVHSTVTGVVQCLGVVSRRSNGGGPGAILCQSVSGLVLVKMTLRQALLRVLLFSLLTSFYHFFILIYVADASVSNIKRQGLGRLLICGGMCKQLPGVGVSKERASSLCKVHSVWWVVKIACEVYSLYNFFLGHGLQSWFVSL